LLTHQKNTTSICLSVSPTHMHFFIVLPAWVSGLSTFRPQSFPILNSCEYRFLEPTRCPLPFPLPLRILPGRGVPGEDLKSPSQLSHRDCANMTCADSSRDVFSLSLYFSGLNRPPCCIALRSPLPRLVLHFPPNRVSTIRSPILALPRVAPPPNLTPSDVTLERAFPTARHFREKISLFFFPSYLPSGIAVHALVFDNFPPPSPPPPS